MKEEERSRFGLVALGGYVYAVGGRNLFTHSTFHSVERYDPDTNSWQLMKSVDMPVPAFPCGISKVVALDGLIYAIGGQRGEVYTYNPQTYLWTEVAPLQHVCHAANFCTLKGKIYAIGIINHN